LSQYFQGLNYSLANEDTWIEHRLAPEGTQSIFSVCGSGSRVIPLLAKKPEQLHIVDLSETQLALFRLRHAAIRYLEYEEFLFLLGYKRVLASTTRVSLLSRLNLSQNDLELWKKNEIFWSEQGFIYLGKWERHFMKIGRLFQKLTFKDLRPLFEARNLDEQRSILNKHWKPEFFRIYCKVVMNEWVANRLLYKGSYAGGKGKKTMQETAAEFVFREINDLFQNTWLRGNYFLNMIFLNEVSAPESFPAECDQAIFQQVKKAETKVSFHQQNLLELLLKHPHDFYSLSDTFSYMQDAEVMDFLSKLPEDIKPSTKIVIRTFMRKPTFKVSSPWVSDPKVNKDLAHNDCTRMYEMSVLTKV
jgi:S-adenosylmethionine-diacylglycerol 3-amino-3-carboxypropyl transferase